MYKTEFINYMVEVEKKAPTTAYQYGEAVERISRNHSRNVGQYIDIYQMEDLGELNNIQTEYEMGNAYIEFGKAALIHKQAFMAYIRFMEWQSIALPNLPNTGLTSSSVPATFTSSTVTPSVALTGDRIYSSYEKFTPEQKTECYTYRFDFQQYMAKFEDKTETTIGLYSSAIRRISKLLSWKTGKKVDIYQINDLSILANIRKEFNKDGKLYAYYLSGNTSKNIHIQTIETYIRFMSIKELRTVVNLCQKNRPFIKIRPTPSPQTKSITKNEAIYLCISNGLNINEKVTFASKNSGSNTYWANPDIQAVLQDWSLILNDLEHYKLHIFNIPRDSIKEWQIKVRADLPNKIDLQILYENELFEDMRSGIQFCKWFVKTISYAN